MSYGTFGSSVAGPRWPSMRNNFGHGAYSYTALKPSPPASPAAADPSLPVIYRCSLLCVGDRMQGVKLGVVGSDQELRVVEVCSQTLSDICHIAPGDVVTHANGVEVHGCMEMVRRICAGSQGIVELRLLRGRCGKMAAFDEGRRSQTSTRVLWESPVFLYEVHPCDSLQTIADIFGTTQDTIRKDNRGCFEAGFEAMLQPGQHLKIRNLAAIDANEHISTTIDTTEESSERNWCRRRYHEVAKGETLETIAKMYGLSVSDVRASNRNHFPVGEAGALRPGMRLLLFETSRENTGKPGS